MEQWFISNAAKFKNLWYSILIVVLTFACVDSNNIDKNQYNKVNKKLNGQHPIYNADGNLIHLKNYNKGELDGWQISFYYTGTLKSRMYFLKGKKEGVELMYHKNGNLLSESTYKDGQIDGIWLLYDKKNRLQFEGHYSKGLKNGAFIDYDSLGIVTKKQIFNNDTLIK